MAAFGRLKSTIIETNIRPKDGEGRALFSWIDSAAMKKRRRRDGTVARPDDYGISITVSDWVYRSVLDGRALLSIDPAYFSITGGRERWLYRVARKHAGAAGANGFAIKFPTLFEKSGAEGTYSRFKFELQKIALRNALPGFDLFLEAGRGTNPSLRMIRKGASQATEPDGWPEMPAVYPPLADDTMAFAHQHRCGADVYALKADFDRWLGQQPDRAPPDDYQAEFRAFICT